MAVWAKSGGIRRTAPAAALALAAGAALAACAGPSAFAGIPLAPGAAEAGVQRLASRALAGDEGAQLELGIRFAEGRGVPVDLRRALFLYRLAAKASGGTAYVYVPPTGQHGRGGLIPVYRAEPAAGLEEARLRLRRLRARLSGAPAR